MSQEGLFIALVASLSASLFPCVLGCVSKERPSCMSRCNLQRPLFFPFVMTSQCAAPHPVRGLGETILPVVIPVSGTMGRQLLVCSHLVGCLAMPSRHSQNFILLFIHFVHYSTIYCLSYYYTSAVVLPALSSSPLLGRQLTTSLPPCCSPSCSPSLA